jgi:hypothetical protein
MKRPTLIVRSPLNSDFNLIGAPELVPLPPEHPDDSGWDVTLAPPMDGAPEPPNASATWKDLKGFTVSSGWVWYDREKLYDNAVAFQGDAGDGMEMLADGGYDVIRVGRDHTETTDVLVYPSTKQGAPVVAVLLRGCTMQIGLPKFYVDMPDPERDTPDVYAEPITDPKALAGAEDVAAAVAGHINARRLGALTYDLDDSRGGLRSSCESMSTALCAAGFTVIEVRTDRDAASRVLETACRAFEREREHERAEREG